MHLNHCKHAPERQGTDELPNPVAPQGQAPVGGAGFYTGANSHSSETHELTWICVNWLGVGKWEILDIRAQ